MHCSMYVNEYYQISVFSASILTHINCASSAWSHANANMAGIDKSILNPVSSRLALFIFLKQGCITKSFQDTPWQFHSVLPWAELYLVLLMQDHKIFNRFSSMLRSLFVFYCGDSCPQRALYSIHLLAWLSNQALTLHHVTGNTLTKPTRFKISYLRYLWYSDLTCHKCCQSNYYKPTNQNNGNSRHTCTVTLN